MAHAPGEGAPGGGLELHARSEGGLRVQITLPGASAQQLPGASAQQLAGAAV